MRVVLPNYWEVNMEPVMSITTGGLYGSNGDKHIMWRYGWDKGS